MSQVISLALSIVILCGVGCCEASCGGQRGVAPVRGAVHAVKHVKPVKKIVKAAKHLVGR